MFAVKTIADIAANAAAMNHVLAALGNPRRLAVKGVTPGMVLEAVAALKPALPLTPDITRAAFMNAAAGRVM